ncbi:MAG: HesA/MoeB/ThiF family protein [Candidatus Marinimicrobia bacterium]|nr:HesA/MoeB/ThiF family protein [Candidatus Neomarinimicrobiota bacterium]MDD9887870.1 HesA/MoeB/ThiF family protein [Candidatus Neomarinimicrobiota bacterium]MDD9930962.1 HesA/MoeB/ThiF family protein [Candidatus Neomarinimicrobiota bacterium]
MIITPKELNERKSELTVIDVRPIDQRTEFPMEGLDTVLIGNGAEINGEKVLVCQFGIVTEGMIIENELDDTFSLLGGAQAWDEFYRVQKDLSRWSRQTVLPEIGIEGQKKLLNANVAIVGMGGLGCPAAQSLLTAGVGHLQLIDGDVVSLSNLHRQPLYSPNDVDKKKVEVAKEKLNGLNSETSIQISDAYLDEKNANEFLANADVIIDATDNIQTRQLIDKISKKKNTPMVYGALFRFEGQVSALNVDGSPGYAELFPEPPSSGDTCEDAGVLGMLPGIIGNIQALEAVKLIIGIEPNLIGKLLIYDGMNHSTEIIKI